MKECVGEFRFRPVFLRLAMDLLHGANGLPYRIRLLPNTIGQLIGRLFDLPAQEQKIAGGGAEGVDAAGNGANFAGRGGERNRERMVAAGDSFQHLGECGDAP